MRLFPFLRLPASLRRRGVPARIGSLTMVFQKSPLLPMLPEARLISSSGFSEAVKWTVTAVAGLGAFDSVSGVSVMSQISPNPGSLTVPGVAGDPLNFVFQTTGTPHPTTNYTTTTLPPGLTLKGGVLIETRDSIFGTPTQAGNFEVTITAWESPNRTGDTFFEKFTFQIVNPPLPEINVPPAGGNFTAGTFVSVSAGQTSGRTFKWTRNGADLPPQEKLFCPRTAVRKFRTAPLSDPGAAWRSGDPFVESTDTSSQSDPAWSTVSGGIGYDTDGATGGNYLPSIVAGDGDMQSLMFGSATSAKPVAVHLRMQFTIPDPEILTFLTLRVQSDDGFVAWLNGTEIAGQNKPSILAWNSPASLDITLDTPTAFREFNISQHLGLLRPGSNLLAVQAMNSSPASVDFLFNCELAGGVNAVNSPYLTLTNIQPSTAGSYALTVTNPAGTVSTNPVPLLVKPSLQSQPASVTIENGAAALLTVTATGSSPFFYQWYTGLSGDTSSPVPGAQQSEFTTAPLTETVRYWVRVLSPAGTVNSSTATVTVNPPIDTYAVWKAALFSVEQNGNPDISGAAADPDADGITNEEEYVFGTLPLQPDSILAPAIAVNGGQIEVIFTARKAAGPGYTGRTRSYTVETTADVTNGPWAPLPGAAGIIANDQSVTITLPQGPSRIGCRLKVRLTP